MTGLSLTWCVFCKFGLVGLKAFAEVLVKGDDITIRMNDRDVYTMRVLSDDDESTRTTPRNGNRPSLVGTQFTS